MSSHNPNVLPDNLPVPVDDGACDHLLGMRIPQLPLMSTTGQVVELTKLPGETVVYCYPRTGRPGQELPKGWDEIPGARGCTPQSCAFRDNFHSFQKLNVRVYGLSTQDSDYQREAVKRLNLPFELLSDAQLKFSQALKLPTFMVEDMALIKRLTMILNNGKVVKVFYPVFPPDKNAEQVRDWLTRK